MRLAPLLAAIVCLVLTGSTATAGAPAAGATAPSVAGLSTRSRAEVALAPSSAPTPSATPAPATPVPSATATPATPVHAAMTPSPAPAAPAALADVAARPEGGIPTGSVAPAGQQIVISLTCQELSAYQDGAPVLSTLVTTGRPALPTPTGTYSVLSRNVDFTMVSTWPYGSMGWYPPSLVDWVLWFRDDGYGIHDASWRTAYGPGTEANGSHGCVNVPHAAMRTLYAWATVGTSVDIY